MSAQSLETSNFILLDPTLTVLSALLATLFTFAALSSFDSPIQHPFNHLQNLLSRPWMGRFGILLDNFLAPLSKMSAFNYLSFSHWLTSTSIKNSNSSSNQPLLDRQVGPFRPLLSILSRSATTTLFNPSNDNLSPKKLLATRFRGTKTCLQNLIGIKPYLLKRVIICAYLIGLMYFIGLKAINDLTSHVLVPIPMLLPILLGICLGSSAHLIMSGKLTMSCQLIYATIMSFGLFGFHYAGLIGIKIISYYPSQSHISSLDITWIMAALSITICLISIGLLVHTLSLAQNRSQELIKTKRELEQLRLEKQEVDRIAILKQNFISVASHELRTPLFSVTGYSELLARTDLNNEQTWYLNNLQQACSNMQLIIANVLDFSTLEKNNPESWAKPTSVNIREMLEGIAQMIEDKGGPANRKRSVELIVHVADNVPETALIDQTFMMRICMNLLSNALKFTERGFIMIELDLGTVNQLVIKVQDTGIGIPPAFMSALFEPYRQADSTTTRPHQGTGLGLSICKQLVERLNGKIEVHSIEAKGTTFTVHLPFEKSTSPSTDSIERPPRTICLAYHDKTTEEKLYEILQKGGHQAIRIHSHPELASKMLKNGKIDLVLTDSGSIESSTILQAAIDRGNSSTKGLRACVDDTDNILYPTFVLTSSTDLDHVANESLLIGARNVIKLRRQGIIPHLIFDMLLAPSKYTHEIELLMSTTKSKDDRLTSRRATFSSISSLSPTSFQFDPPSDQIVESPCSTPSVISNEDHNGILPLNDPSEAREKCEMVIAKPQRQDINSKILLVDDNHFNVQLGKKLLQVLGYEVEVAYDGFEAIEKAEKWQYSLILMDCHMPGMGGLEATKKIRESERNRNRQHNPEKAHDKKPVPIIALTASVSSSDEMECKMSGMDGFLSKPLRLDVLKDTLHTYLG